MDVHDPIGFLAGGWRFERTVEDRRSGQSGSAAGEATFLRRGPGLVWRERGRLEFGRFSGAANRTLLIEPEAAGWMVRFEDGRPFHHLELAAGACSARHPCREDLYDGRLAATGPDGLVTEWEVRGPAKDLRILTEYRREG